MDRNKSAPGARGPKGKITQQPPDMFIALGQKSSTSRDVDSKRAVPLPKSSTGAHLQPGTSKSILLLINFLHQSKKSYYFRFV